MDKAIIELKRHIWQPDKLNIFIGGEFICEMPIESFFKLYKAVLMDNFEIDFLDLKSLTKDEMDRVHHIFVYRNCLWRPIDSELYQKGWITYNGEKGTVGLKDIAEWLFNDSETYYLILKGVFTGGSCYGTQKV